LADRSLTSQEKGGDDRSGPYNVVAGLAQTVANRKTRVYLGLYRRHFRRVANRIFVANRGELKLPDKLPANFTGFWGSLGSAAPGGQTPEFHNCIVVVDATGEHCRVLDTMGLPL